VKSRFAIDGRAVGIGEPCYVIAEAGVNHNCDVQLGYKLIETAGASGADAIKFQSYTASKIATRVAPRYWVEAADPEGTQWDTFDKLDKLSARDFKSLLGHARHVGLTAFSTPFDDEAVDFLASLDVPAFKIASADLTCHGLIDRAARVGKPMLLSTGTSTLAEVEEALEVCRRAGNEEVALLHCTLKYPCPPEAINLRMMEHLMRAFPGVPVGLSDHTLGIHIAVAAVGRGAMYIEKHFTLDRALDGPDHQASLDPEQLRGLIRAIRDVEAALGDGVKGPTRNELPIRDVARKSLVAARDLPAGTIVGPDDLVILRPGTGLPPGAMTQVLGRKTARAIPADTPLSEDMLL